MFSKKSQQPPSKSKPRKDPRKIANKPPFLFNEFNIKVKEHLKRCLSLYGKIKSLRVFLRYARKFFKENAVA